MIKFLNSSLVLEQESSYGWKLEQSVCLMPTFRSKELDARDFWRLCGMQLPHRIAHDACKNLVYFMDQINISV